MFDLSLRGSCATLLLVLGTAACSSIDTRSQQLVESLSIYKVEVVQGNFVAKEQVDALKPGMAREQVKDILGTPLLISVFHSDRWDYVFTLRRQGAEPQARQLTVYFKGDVLERFEGDAMPSESEFVGMLARAQSKKSVPNLEASEAQLKAFPSAATPANNAAAPAAATAYPPLEVAPTR